MFLLAFWTWHCTTFNSIPIILNLLTNRDIALIYSVIICEQKTKDCARSGSFQQKLQHHCFQLWCLPGFLTSLLYWLWLKVQRTGHYLSPGGGGDFGRDHLIFRKTKWGINRNWEPKRGDNWKLWRDSERGPLKFAWKMKTWGGGDRESHQMLLGGITSVK